MIRWKDRAILTIYTAIFYAHKVLLACQEKCDEKGHGDHQKLFWCWPPFFSINLKS